MSVPRTVGASRSLYLRTVSRTSARPSQLLRIRPSFLPIPARTAAQRRWASTLGTAQEKFKASFKKDPFGLSLAFAFLAISMGIMGYVSYTMFFQLQPVDHNYPKSVASRLKKAIYYSSLDPDLLKALKFYQQALDAAQDEKMNPFSDEVIGIKLRIASVLENNKQPRSAVQVLEMLKAELRQYIELYGDRADLKEHRTRLLRKVVQISIKLGQLYSSEAINNVEQAEKNLTEGVEMTLVESTRRTKERATDESDGPWMSNEEVGATLEELAYHFEQKSQYSLSSPLFLRALTLGPPPCHAAMLMNNLSASIAQTAPDSSLGAPTSKATLLSNATAWAEKAIAVAADAKGNDRTAECDQACAVATLNLGEFAEMEGLLAQAHTHYVKASSLAKTMGFTDVRQRADQALKRLNQHEQ